MKPKFVEIPGNKMVCTATGLTVLSLERQNLTTEGARELMDAILDALNSTPQK